jgi:hypothetical protein
MYYVYLLGHADFIYAKEQRIQPRFIDLGCDFFDTYRGQIIQRGVCNQEQLQQLQQQEQQEQQEQIKNYILDDLEQIKNSSLYDLIKRFSGRGAFQTNNSFFSTHERTIDADGKVTSFNNHRFDSNDPKISEFYSMAAYDNSCTNKHELYQKLTITFFRYCVAAVNILFHLTNGEFKNSHDEYIARYFICDTKNFFAPLNSKATNGVRILLKQDDGSFASCMISHKPDEEKLPQVLQEQIEICSRNNIDIQRRSPSMFERNAISILLLFVASIIIFVDVMFFTTHIFSLARIMFASLTTQASLGLGVVCAVAASLLLVIFSFRIFSSNDFKRKIYFIQAKSDCNIVKRFLLKTLGASDSPMRLPLIESSPIKLLLDEQPNDNGEVLKLFYDPNSSD